MPDCVVRCSHEDWADKAIALPAYATSGAAGADVRANFPDTDRANGIELAPGQRALIPTGLRVEIPTGYEMQLRPRSGLALKQGLTLLNTPGTIDSDYRGPLGVILINLGQKAVQVSHGDRIAQAIVSPVIQAQFASFDTLSDSDRGVGGFGSTGVV